MPRIPLPLCENIYDYKVFDPQTNTALYTNNTCRVFLSSEHFVPYHLLVAFVGYSYYDKDTLFFVDMTMFQRIVAGQKKNGPSYRALQYQNLQNAVSDIQTMFHVPHTGSLNHFLSQPRLKGYNLPPLLSFTIPTGPNRVRHHIENRNAGNEISSINPFFFDCDGHSDPHRADHFKCPWCVISNATFCLRCRPTFLLGLQVQMKVIMAILQTSPFSIGDFHFLITTTAKGGHLTAIPVKGTIFDYSLEQRKELYEKIRLHLKPCTPFSSTLLSCYETLHQVSLLDDIAYVLAFTLSGEAAPTSYTAPASPRPPPPNPYLTPKPSWSKNEPPSPASSFRQPPSAALQLCPSALPPLFTPGQHVFFQAVKVDRQLPNIFSALHPDSSGGYGLLGTEQ